MARDYENDDDYNDRSPSGGSGGYGHSGESHKTSKADRDSKNFDTTSLVGEDGTFFGVKLSSGTASALNGASSMVKPWLRRTVQDKGEAIAQDLAQKHWGMNAGEAAKFGVRTGEALGWATIFSDQIADLGSNFAATFRSMNELRHAVTPSMKVNGQNSHLHAMFGGADNDIVKNARSKIRGIFMARNVQTVVKSIANVPQIMLWNEEEKFKRRDRQLRNALKGSSNPEELVKLFEEEMGAGLSVNMEAARDKLWNQLWKAKTEKYLTGFKEFEKTKQKAIEKEFFEELGFKGNSLKKEIDQPTYEMLEKYGLGGYYKQKTAPRAGYKPSHGSWIPEDPVDGVYEIRAKDSTAEKGFKKKLEQTVTDKIKAEYVKEHGALDENWKEKLNVGRGGRGRGGYGGGYGYNNSRDGENANKTIRERDYDRFTKAFDEAHGLGKTDAHAKKEEEGTNKQLKEIAYSLGGSLVGDFFAGVFGTKSLDKYRKDIALDLILHLQRSMEKDDSLDHVPPRENSRGEGDVGFAKYIHSIFQKNQEDSGKSQVGERYFTHLKEAKWDDEAVQKLDDKELTPYEYAIKHLSKAIKDRRMDPLSLITFVGDKKRKLVRDSGKSFGPVGANGNEEKVKEAIAREFQEFGAQFRTQKEMSAEQISQAMADFTFTVEDTKALFASTAASEEKAFVLMVLESHITDKKTIKELTGLDEKALEPLRKEAQGRFNKLMDAGVVILADIAENHPEKLQALEMTPEEIDVIKTISCKIEKGGENVVESTDKEERNALETAVANAAVSLSKEKDKDGPGFWQRLVDRSRKKLEKKEAKVDEGEELSSRSHDDMDGEEHEEHRHDKKKKKKHKGHSDDALDEEMDKEFSSPRLDEEDDRATSSSFAEREEKRGGRGFGKEDDDKPMLERLSARKSRDDSQKPSWDMSA